MPSRIETLLNNIKTAIYGKEVRDSIHDAIEECYTDTSTSATAATAAATAANNAAAAANTAAEEAEALKTVNNYIAGDNFVYDSELQDGTQLFTSSNVSEGEKIYYSVEGYDGYTALINLYDANNVRLAWYGKASSSDSNNYYEGFFTIPSGFSYATFNAANGNVSYKAKALWISKHSGKTVENIDSLQKEIELLPIGDTIYLNEEIKDSTTIFRMTDDKIYAGMKLYYAILAHTGYTAYITIYGMNSEQQETVLHRYGKTATASADNYYEGSFTIPANFTKATFTAGRTGATTSGKILYLSENPPRKQLDNYGIVNDNYKKNWIDRNSLVADRFINSNGESTSTSSSAGKYHTRYIPVYPGCEISLSWVFNGTQNYCIAFYDGDKQFVASQLLNRYETPIVVPEGCYYTRVTLPEYPTEKEWIYVIPPTRNNVNDLSTRDIGFEIQKVGQTYEGFGYNAFPSVCYFAGKELVIFRCAPQHQTVPNNYGGIEIVAINQDGTFEKIKYISTATYSDRILGELRVNSASVTDDGKTLFLAGFTTRYINDDTSQAKRYENFVMTLDTDFNVTGLNVHHTDTSAHTAAYLMTSKVLVAPSGKLIVAGHNTGSTKIVIFKSNVAFDGTNIESITWSNPIEIYSDDTSVISECDLAYTDSELVCIVRANTVNGVVLTCSDKEGGSDSNDWSSYDLGTVVHMPKILHYIPGNYMVFVGAKYIGDYPSTATAPIRYPIIGVYDLANNSLIQEASICNVFTDFGSYAGFEKRSDDIYDVVWYTDTGTKASDLSFHNKLTTTLNYKTINLRTYTQVEPVSGGTVEDGSITYAKLDSNLKGAVDDVVDLKTRLSEHKDVQVTYKDLDNPTVIDGFYKASDGSFNSNPVLVTKKVAHIAGTLYRYIGRLYGSAGYYGVTYLDSSDAVIGGRFISNTTATWEDAIINPPVGTATVAFTTNKDNSTNNADSYMHVQQIVSIPIEDKQYQGDLGFLDIMPLNADYMHIPIYGQSLSIGADAPYHNDGAVGGLFMLGGLDDVGMNAGFKPLELTSGCMNPIVPALHDLKKIADSNGINHRIIATSSGKGARSIAQLMSQARQDEIQTERSIGYSIDADSPIQYLKWTDDVNKIKTIVVDRLELSVKCPAIIFLQGERDFYTDAQLNTAGAEKPNAYACGDNKALYKTYMSRLKDDMQTYIMNKYGQTIKPIFAIYPCSGEFITTTTMGITMAQQEFARENDDVILLSPQYPVPNYTNGHCTTNGYRWFGEYIGKALAEVFVHGNKPKQLEAHSGYVIGNKAFISTDGGCLPLVIDNYTVQQKTNCGFKLYVNGAEATVTKVETQGHFIILTSSSNMDSASKVEVTYAQDVFGGHGNIRDSLPYKGQYSYLDDTNDNGTSGTLSITYRTKDKDGNAIIGQRYPMWNWLVPFYLKIVG